METKNRTHLKIITPKGIFYDEPVSIVTVKTTEGYIGIQTGRVPIVASIEISPLNIGTKGSPNYKDCAIAGGLLYADKNTVTIITDSVEEKSKIDIKKETRNKEMLEKKLKSKLELVEIRKLKIALQKSINLINVSKL
ncbi:MAG: ATP synthase F1 subunit epsilon [Mycoplasma sp.]|nr:ATP synthase F1 subunit epsilon [Mycoplasma sp.]